MSSTSPLFRRKPATPTSPSPSPAPKSLPKKSLFPPPSSSPQTPRRRPSDISLLPSALSSATHVAASPLLSSGILHSYNNPNPNPGESSATAAAAAPAPMFRAKPSTASASSAAAGGGGLDAHEKMWAEMQQKLQEVELSADHVFGATHAQSLQELRAAQIALAQAWMRSEEGGGNDIEGGGGGREGLDGEHVEFGRGAFGSERGFGKGKGVAGGVGGGGDVGGEMEGDVLLARKRRLANDEHFSRVARSVQDVTRKLESVAEAMANVEMESRGIWAGSTESDGTSIR